MIGVPTSTVAPSATSSPVTTPANGHGSSTSDFAVSISTIGSLTFTVSPDRDLPLHDVGLGQALAGVREPELLDASLVALLDVMSAPPQNASARSTASSTRSRSGRYSSSSRLAGYGRWNPPTRSTGASRW